LLLVSALQNRLWLYLQAVRRQYWPYFIGMYACFLVPFPSISLARAQVIDNTAQELLRQQERERVRREQLEAAPETRFPEMPRAVSGQLPLEEHPCFLITHIQLIGEDANYFLWAVAAADPKDDPATGRCLGTTGINVVMSRIQNAIITRGFITTRVLAGPQDLTSGILQLTVVPGKISTIRFAAEHYAKTGIWNTVPAASGDVLNLRAIEQALENFKRVPTVEADIQITPAESTQAQPGESDVVITWQQRRPPLRLNMGLDDAGSQQTGKLQANLTLSLDNLLHGSDLFYIHAHHDVLNSHHKGSRGYTTHYSIPYGYWLLAASVNNYNYRQTVFGFNQNYIYSGKSDNAELRLSRLIYRNATRKTGIYGRGWVRRSHNFIDDTEIEIQRRRTAGWELGVTYRHYIGVATLDAEVAYKRGTGAFNAMRAPEEKQGEGSSRPQIISAHTQWQVPFQIGMQSWRYSTYWRAQWNRSTLVAQDRFAIGGRYSVRGFDGESSLLGQRGWIVRNDLGLGIGLGQEFYLGTDYGYVGGLSKNHLSAHHLAGAVLGMRGSIQRVTWDIFIGTPINKPQGFKSDPLTTGFQVNGSY